MGRGQRTACGVCVFANLVIFVGIIGAILALQSPTNTELARYVGHTHATLVSFAGGFLVLLMLTPLLGSGDLSRLGEAQWWQFLGGIYGVFIVIIVTYAVPLLGVALALTAIMLGNISFGMLIDAFGWFQATVVPFDGLRMLGCGFMAVSIVFIYISRVQSSANAVTDEGPKEKGMPSEEPGSTGKALAKSLSRRRFGGRSLAMLLLSFLAGMGGAAQAPTNGSLGVIIGTVEASLVSFGVGFLAILIVALISGGWSWRSFRASPPWTWLGGLYGAASVFSITVATPVIGVGIAVSTNTLGQLIGAFVIDGLGLLRVPKVPFDAYRLIGIALLAVGITIITYARI